MPRARSRSSSTTRMRVMRAPARRATAYRDDSSGARTNDARIGNLHDRDPYAENSTGLRARLDADRAAQCRDQLAHDGEPDACPRDLPGCRRQPGERLEDALTVGVG